METTLRLTCQTVQLFRKQIHLTSYGIKDLKQNKILFWIKGKFYFKVPVIYQITKRSWTEDW